MRKKPLVSVIIPFYDKLDLLKRSVKSVSDQSFKNFEIIVVNDNPNKYKRKDILRKLFFEKNLRVIFNKKNFGAGISRNNGIKISKGKYIAFLDSDDKWKKNNLKFQLNKMIKRHQDISHTSYYIVDERNQIISKRYAKNLSFKNLIKSCDIGLSTVILKTKLLKNIKKPFPSLKTKEDYVLWLNLSKKNYTFYGYSQFLTNWTDRKNSLSKSIIQKLFDAFKVYNKYQRMNMFNTIFSTIRLSLNYLKK